MKRSRFTEEQIAFALHQADTGTSVEEVCRKVGIFQATFYAWKKKFGSMGLSELRRLRQLVGHLIDRYRISIQRACRVCLQSRAGWYQKPKGKPLDEPLRARMREIANTRIRFGFWRIYVLLRREGWRVNQAYLQAL